MSHTFVDNEERDALFKKLMQHAENTHCMDCKHKNPKWASATYGIFLCYNCTSRHREYGTHISFVRSCEMDKWNQKQLNAMELGGNKHFGEFLKKNGISLDKTIDYTIPVMVKYKTDIKRRSEALFVSQGGSVPIVSTSAKAGGLFGTAAVANIAASGGSSSSTSSSSSSAMNHEGNGMAKNGNGFSSGSMNSHASRDKGVMFGKPSKKNDQVNLGAKKLDNFDFDNFDWGGDNFKPASNGSFKVGGVSNVHSEKEAEDTAAISAQLASQKLDSPQKTIPVKEEKKIAENGAKSTGPKFVINMGLDVENDVSAKKTSNDQYSSKKAISSREFFGEDESTEDDKRKFNQFSGQAAISSDQFFDREPKRSVGSEDPEEKVREMAAQIGVRARELKSKAGEYFSNLRHNIQS